MTISTRVDSLFMPVKKGKKEVVTELKVESVAKVEEPVIETVVAKDEDVKEVIETFSASVEEVPAETVTDSDKVEVEVEVEKPVKTTSKKSTKK